MTEIPVRLFLHSIVEQGMEEDFWSGIQAAVWFYYENYTDATDVDDELLPLLERLVALLDLNLDDLSRTIQDAEASYNGDPQSSRDSEGKRRTVRTESAYVVEDDEED